MGIESPQTPLYSLRVRGLWEGVTIFYIVRGSQRVRSASTYDLSAKTHLISFQSAFATAVSEWKALTAAQKRTLDLEARALKKRYSGFNLYLSRALKIAYS
jgi:hypothetical protein